MTSTANALISLLFNIIILYKKRPFYKMHFNALGVRKRLKVYYVYKVIFVPPRYASVIFDFIVFF